VSAANALHRCPTGSGLPVPCRPGLRYGATPERGTQDPRSTPVDRWLVDAFARLVRYRDERGAAARSGRIDARVAELRSDTVAAGAAALDRLRIAVRRDGHDERTAIEALALAALAAERTLGLVPRDGQRRAADALLRTRFVEMSTGEGKTLATALAASAAALDGTPVHVLTVNDYLAERDATQLAPLYAALSLSSACVLPTMDDDERRGAYAADIVHVTGKQIGFDWMRDALQRPGATGALAERLGSLARTHDAWPPGGRSQPLLRGLCFGIVDEADSLLVDEARTPLVLAVQCGTGSEAEHEGILALALAGMLNEGEDFRVSPERRDVTLSARGSETVARLAERLEGPWRATRYRDERVRQALTVRHLWRRDRDYVVRDGRIELVDEHTGRALPDRRLQQGLHALLELEERCTPTPESDVVASIACQRLFRRYVRLAGTSGTLHEVRGELSRVYDARLQHIAPACPSRLERRATVVFADREARLDALIEEIEACLVTGQAVLIGTRSVAESGGVSARLTAHGIAHRLLNARHDDEEAATVAAAGTRGRVTVATNMAGRGTDILLGDGVATLGGLHIVSLAFNDARRIDRQLAGRAARQGAPGSFRQLWSLDDPLLVEHSSALLRTTLQRALDAGRFARPVRFMARFVIRRAQRRIERRHARQRSVALAIHERNARRVAIGSHPDLRS